MVMFEGFQTVRRWLGVIENISPIVWTRYSSYKLTKCFQNGFCPETTSKTESRGRHIQQQSATFLLRDYVSDLHHAEMEIKDRLVLRPRLQIERTAEARINTSTISTCWSKKQLVNREIWEPLFIIERLKRANVDIYLWICVCLY